MRKDLRLMKRSGEINRSAIQIGIEAAKPGVSLKEIDKEIEAFIRSQGALPAFLNYNGFPGSSCLSLNDVLIHGIPDNTVLANGDLLTIDVGTKYQSHITDAAISVQIGEGEDTELLLHGSRALESQLAVLRSGVTLYDLAIASTEYAKRSGVHIYPEFGGHGVGLSLHGDPFIPSVADPKEFHRLKITQLFEGETICIEPVVSLIKDDFYIDEDGWTVKSKNKTKAVHFEKCVLITKEGYEVLA